ncbi:MAG: hypothetical protein ACOCY9_02255, partial [Desulfohalobiaceae bacterium]
MTGKHKKIWSIMRKDREYTRQNRAMCFLPGNRLPENTSGDSLLGKLQNRLKGQGKFYYLLLRLFAPVYASRELRRLIRQELSALTDQEVIINLGSGPQILND